jgi:hypothetical protein
VLVATVAGALRLTRVQPSGGSEMDGIALVQGRKIGEGDRLGKTGRPETPAPMIVPLAPS